MKSTWTQKINSISSKEWFCISELIISRSSEQWNLIKNIIQICKGKCNFNIKMYSEANGRLIRSNKWSIYDDKVVKEVSDWSEVIKICLGIMAKPTMLFF